MYLSFHVSLFISIEEKKPRPFLLNYDALLILNTCNTRLSFFQNNHSNRKFYRSRRGIDLRPFGDAGKWEMPEIGHAAPYGNVAR